MAYFSYMKNVPPHAKHFGWHWLFKLPFAGNFSNITQIEIKQLSRRFCNDLDIKSVFSSYKIKNFFSFKHPVPAAFKVFRYSFFGTIPNFLNRLLDSLLLVRSKWNLQYLLVLNWTLACFTFCENRYFHDNDKQKSSKILKLKFSVIQISLWKANTSILNCGVWQKKYTRTKKFCMFVLK